MFLTNRGLYYTADSGHMVPQTDGHDLSTLEQNAGILLYKNRLVINVKPFVLFRFPWDLMGAVSRINGIRQRDWPHSFA